MASVVAACRSLALVVLAVGFTGAAAGSSSKTFNITSSCSYTVWPAISSGRARSSSTAAQDNTGFELAPGEWKIVAVPSGWSGRVWGRTLCSSNNEFTCVTGDCGSGRLDCAGGGNAVAVLSPATLAEFTLDNGSRGMDTYDVNLVDGFNLPLLVGGAGNCAPTGCVADLNAVCPDELRATSGTGGAVACKSACQAFGLPQYCCTGEYGGTCMPSLYSELFKKACPRAYSYAHDGAGSTFTCAAGTDSDTYYSITFCPSTTSGPRPEAPETTTGNLPLIIHGGSTTTTYPGGDHVGGEKSASGPYYSIVLAAAVLGVVTAVLGLIKVICFG